MALSIRHKRGKKFAIERCRAVFIQLKKIGEKNLSFFDAQIGSPGVDGDAVAVGDAEQGLHLFPDRGGCIPIGWKRVGDKGDEAYRIGAFHEEFPEGVAPVVVVNNLEKSGDLREKGVEVGVMGRVHVEERNLCIFSVSAELISGAAHQIARIIVEISGCSLFQRASDQFQYISSLQISG